MTNLPAASAAPIDFAQLRAAAQEAENSPQEPRRETFDIGAHSWPLVTEITPLDMIELQDAQESGSFRELITAMPRLIPKEYREGVLEILLADPDDATQRISFDDLLAEFKRASEVINARPTDR
jgi:hypothetical protein